jgi:hypothetical protein
MLLVAICKLGRPPTSCAQDMAPLERIVEAWNQRKQAFERITYRIVGDGVARKGVLPPDASVKEPDADHEYKIEYQIHLDVKNNRCRLETTRDYLISGEGYRPMVEIAMWNGEFVQKHRPREANRRAGREPGPKSIDLYEYADESTTFFFGASDQPLLLAHAILSSRPSKLNERTIAESFEIKGIEAVDGRRLIVLQCAPRADGVRPPWEYYCDPRRDFEIVRLSISSAGFPRARADMKYRADAAGHKILDSWEWRSFRGGKEIKHEKCRIVDAQLNGEMSDELFQIEKTSGMYVWDVAADTKYVVP